MKQTDFRPDLLPSIRKLEIHAKRNVLSTSLAGNWISKIRGHGIEFSGYRQYNPTDDAGMIDWKASARSGKLLVKELDEEKNLNIFLFVDVSDTMLFGTTDKIKAEFVAELVSSLSFAALRGGESVSLTTWSDRITHFVPLKLGLGQHAAMMRVLSDVHVYTGKKDFAHAANQLLGYMTGQRGLIILLSDFVGFDETWDRYLKIMAEKHDLVAIMVRDPRDRRLPDHGQFILADPSSNEKIVIDAADYAAPYAEYVLTEERRLQALLHRAGSDLLIIETTQEYSTALTKFFQLHNRRSEGQ